MRARKRTSNEREARLLTEIADLVHGVTMPFACGGSLAPAKPVLEAVRRAPLPHDPNPLTADLYCLNVYSSGRNVEIA